MAKTKNIYIKCYNLFYISFDQQLKNIWMWVEVSYGNWHAFLDETENILIQVPSGPGRQNLKLCLFAEKNMKGLA